MPIRLIMREEVSFLPKLRGDVEIRILHDLSPAELCFKRFSVYITGVTNDMLAVPGQKENKEHQREEH